MAVCCLDERVKKRIEAKRTDEAEENTRTAKKIQRRREKRRAGKRREEREALILQYL